MATHFNKYLLPSWLEEPKPMCLETEHRYVLVTTTIKQCSVCGTYRGIDGK